LHKICKPILKMSPVKKIVKRMKVKNELARQVMGEVLGTFVLLVSFCIIFTIKQTKHSYRFIDMVC